VYACAWVRGDGTDGRTACMALLAAWPTSWAVCLSSAPASAIFSRVCMDGAQSG
jgi:hypothetical protein